MQKSYLSGKVIVKVGDITEMDTDAIVNAANSSLLGGGGVDGAIHRAGGVSVLEECRLIRKERYPDGLPTGLAVATKGGNLKARYVIHTVGPVWRGGSAGEEELLSAAYINSLKLAEELGCTTIAFPAVSTGVYGFPTEKAAQIVSRSLLNFFSLPTTIKIVYLVYFTIRDFDVFTQNTGLSA